MVNHLNGTDVGAVDEQQDEPSFDFSILNGLPQGKSLKNPFEQVMGLLVSKIHSGQLPPGTRLPPERELSEFLDVSRVTLRSVIRTLQQAGYLRTMRGRSGGSTVVWTGAEAPAAMHSERMSPAMKERLLDSLVFRSVLEPGAAELAASRKLNPEERANLKRYLEGVIAAGMNSRMADAELHGYIASLSGCKALTEAIQNMQLTLNEQLMQVLPEIGPAMDHSNEQHVQVVDAILNGEASRARNIMFEHVEATRELIVGFMR